MSNVITREKTGNQILENPAPGAKSMESCFRGLRTKQTFEKVGH